MSLEPRAEPLVSEMLLEIRLLFLAADKSLLGCDAVCKLDVCLRYLLLFFFEDNGS
jgi:hypothetical protein